MRVTLDYGKGAQYVESNQTSKLRWILLKYLGEDNYESQTGVFKCRDYMNDFVFKYNKLESKLGVTFHPVYGMSINHMEFEEGKGFIFLIFGIEFPEKFFKNIEFLNSFLANVEMPQLVFIKPDEVIRPDSGFRNCGRDTVKDEDFWALHIPHEYCLSTYRISLISQMIRMCTYDVELKDINQLFNGEGFPKLKDSWGEPLTNLDIKRFQQCKGTLTKYWFKLPTEYVFFAGEGLTSESVGDVHKKHGSLSSYVHNNGFAGYLQQYGVR